MSESNLHALDAIASAWGSWMWNMSWHLTGLVLVLVLLDRLLSGYSARLRFTLWLLVLVRLVVPPDFAAPTGLTWWLGDRLPSPGQSLNAALDDWLAAAPSRPAHNPRSAMGTARANTEPPVEAGAPPEHDASSAPPAPRSSPQGALRWSSTLFLLWLGIVAARLSFLLFGLWQVRKWLNTATAIVDPVTLGLLDNARARIGLPREIGLCNSHACTTPLVTGCLRPVILLPSGLLTSLNPPELEAVLVHEMAHVVRRDGWIRLAQAILSAGYFFHPALWLANWFLRRTCEDACDEQTIAALAGRRRPYAEAIVKAATAVGYEPPQLAVGMLDNGYPVKRRLERILDPRLCVASGGGLARWAFAAVTALLLLPSGAPTSLAIQPETALASEPTAPISEVFDSQAADDRAADDEAADDGAAVEQVAQVAEKEAAENELLELRAWSMLESNDFQERLQAYGSLQRIGSQRSLERLETAFLKRTGIEQDAAKRALDAVWQRLPDTPVSASNSVRLFQVPQED